MFALVFCRHNIQKHRAARFLKCCVYFEKLESCVLSTPPSSTHTQKHQCSEVTLSVIYYYILYYILTLMGCVPFLIRTAYNNIILYPL